jgi:cytoskeletal protein RodZ
MNGEAVGQQLRAAREAQNLSLEQISSATYIRLRYLQAMEAGNFDSLPSQTQARGFLRTVASYLKLAPEPLLALLEAESGAAPGKALAAPGRAPDQPADTTPGAPEAAPGEDDPALTLFQNVGRQLQNRREMLGLSLEEVEKHTRLRQRYLKALETGELDSLPSLVQGRGMLNNYIVFLGMDPEPLLLKFAEGLQARLAVRQGRSGGEAPAAANRSSTGSEQPGTASSRRELKPSAQVGSSRLRRLFSGDVLFGGLAAIALVGFIVWATLRILNLNSQDEISPTAPSIAEVLLSTETPEPTLTLGPGTPAGPGTEQAAVDEPSVTNAPPAEQAEPSAMPTLNTGEVQVLLTVLQRALVQVKVDGETVLNRRVIPGSAYTFNGKQQVEVLTSNGAALQVFYNGADQGLLGLFGQVVLRVFTPQGIITPTPTITPTRPPTQVPTATPAPTETISPNLPNAPTLPPLP